jgi:hypothetical protein
MKILMTRLAEEEKSPSKIRENLFLYYVLPIVTNRMQTIEGIGPDEARLSMLCEYHDKVQNIFHPEIRFAGPDIPLARRASWMSANAIMD